MATPPGQVMRVPSRTPSRTPTRGGRGPGRKGPPRERLPNGTVLKGGAFKIIDVIGEGGFSITYLGMEGTRQVVVAIKELFPLGCVRQGLRVVPGNHWEPKAFEAALDDFVTEGKVLKFFTHPGIVQSYSPFEENGTAYLAMEFLHGESMLTALERRGAMNQEMALEVLNQLGGALELVHASDVIHSDVKPENIIHTEDSRFVLLDFGISRRYVPGRRSKAAVVAVSPGYSPPEQYYASKPLTPAADIYALAATIYTMLSVSMPPDAVSREKGAPLPPLLAMNPTVTPQFWKALEQAMDLNPARRPQTVSEFVANLTGKQPSANFYNGGPSHGDTSALKVEKLTELQGHPGGVCGLLLHPHQPSLISAGRNGSVGLWRWPSGEPIGMLKAHDTAVTGFALSPDGTLLATSGETGEVKLWLVETGQMVRLLHAGRPAVFNLAFSSDSQVVAAAMADGTLHLFHPQRPEPFVLPGHSGAVNCVCLSAYGSLMASAGQDGMVRLWNLETRALIRQFAGHNGGVEYVEFSRDSKLLFSGANDYTTRIWDVEAGLELRRYREDGVLTRAGAFTCDPDLLVAACADKKLRFYRMSTGRKVQMVDADKNYLRAVTCDLRHPFVASGGGDGKIRIWHFEG